MSDEMEARKRLTFEQAEGVAPLPQQLKLRELSHQVRALLWAAIYRSLDAQKYLGAAALFLGGDWADIYKDFLIERTGVLIDKIDIRFPYAPDRLKTIIVGGEYFDVLGLLQFILRHERCPEGLADALDTALAKGMAAYRVIDGNTILPMASEVEGQVLAQAFSDIALTEFHGARQHLKEAGVLLAAGKFAASVRESIHAVEAVARSLSPGAKTLDPALGALAKAGHIHPAQREGFGKLYGFTSDEQGIRHALLDLPEAQVDETDALYMLGSCASFVSYLVRRGVQAGLV